ncbi:hypothetical protein CONLIGDRAFT_647824 [Coniochaeta ligniaria NRRL 30616]|uniref:E3 ubiquitin-protein ligase UBR1-like winged-helix domain-containing protein n=1 Tax=Coniochaeta ligniaria NRRL 30616 TaxID=1408157 RepID=A0A1J7JEU4_9PEZI|nr:hypothetical protein CONLIGDRAFT_647824 [Coniochaeta ligniaria NRRL 30616]
MVLQIPENMQLLLGSSADSMAELPQQAFALTLSDDVLEGMIESVRNGQEIQLSLGDTPSFLFSDQEFPIPSTPTDLDYDLFLSTTATPKSLSRLPHPAMSILDKKNRAALLRQTQGDGAKPKPKPKETRETKPRDEAPRPRTKAEKEQADIDALSASFQQAEAEKRENSTVILEGAVQVKGGKLARAGKSKLLGRQSAMPRSQPGSPALSGLGSPALGPTSSKQAQEMARKLRFPLIHELAARDQSYGDLLPKWEGETEDEFKTHLEKVAHFDGDLQKYTLKPQCWKELDVFAYPYKREEDRQKAIDNAIKKYDRLRLGVSDPLWQKLLPISDRGKGICLSKVQAAIAKGTVAPAPKINVQPAEYITSPSVDSEKEDSASSSNKKPKMGGEPMARTNSGNKTKKVSEAQAQAKRLLSNKPSAAKAPSSKPTSKPSSAKTSPKVSPTKPAPKAATGKGGRVLSKEFISDSDSDSSEEAPLSKTTTASKKAQDLKDTKANSKVKPQPIERATERPKPAEKTRDVPVPKAKPAPAKSTAAPKIMDSIRAEGAKPVRAPKRSREEEDDSSSSGTPLSKRFKNQDHVISKPQPSSEPTKHRKSDSSQNSRGSQSSGTTSSSTKVKTSPVKSSPLASSPPTNASDIDAASFERDTVVAVKKRKFESMRPAEKNHSDRYEKSDSSDSSLSKRAKHGHGGKISEEVREVAQRFKSFYVKYEQLHHELSGMDDPPEESLKKLHRMHNRLIDLKQQIREGVDYTSQ